MNSFEKAKRWLQARTWSDLRSVANSSAARATVLIPILGYWILFNESARPYLNLLKEVGGASPGEVSSRILVVYVGLVCVATGAAIYGFYCPPDVKYYGDPNAYVASVSGTIKDYAQNKIIAALQASDFAEAYHRVVVAPEKTMMTGGILTPDQIDRLDKDILYVNFDMLNASHPAARRSVAWLYSIGFGLLLLSSLTVLGRVVWLIGVRLVSQPLSFL
jgi:hypothetical protein